MGRIVKREALAALLLAMVVGAACGDRPRKARRSSSNVQQPVKDEPAEATQAKHPRAPSRLTRSLREALSAVDRIVVRVGGYPHYAGKLALLHEARGVDAARSLIDLLQFDDDSSGGLCACRGSLMLQFFRGTDLAALISYHHGKRLRWHDGPWLGDGILTQQSQASLRKWLLGAGIDEKLTRE